MIRRLGSIARKIMTSVFKQWIQILAKRRRDTDGAHAPTIERMDRWGEVVNRRFERLLSEMGLGVISMEVMEQI